MADREKLLARLTASNGRIQQIEARREAEMRKRDQLVREAKEAGATWADLTGSGISRATVTKALERR